MAGVKGKSGGPRANSGGSRPGAGRKPAPKREPVVVPVEDGRDMLSLLQDIALGHLDATPIQVRAAIAAVQYTHTKRADGGKKDERQQKAEKVAASNRFAPTAAPKLVHSR